jgi:hypothetical protein
VYCVVAHKVAQGPIRELTAWSDVHEGMLLEIAIETQGFELLL